MNIHTCMPREARANTRAAIPRIGLRSPEAEDSAEATVMAVPATDLGVDASGFFWS